MHPESLRQIPLVRQMLEDPAFCFRPRRVDKHWTYENFIPFTMTGFNPFVGAAFYGSNSFFAKWLSDPDVSARDLNEGDHLLRETLFAVHDYLHSWSVRAIHHCRPDLGFGAAPITCDNVEAFTFCHLVTEAVATVGLDYWYLCRVDLNEVLPIGTAIGALTTSYRERDLPEFRRFNGNLTVQTPGFFSSLVRLYASGRFAGFGVEDMRRSPQILKWMRHELHYAVKQREYVRMWLRYLSAEEIRFPGTLGGPVRGDEPWQTRLVDAIGQLLWEKVMHGIRHHFAPFPSTRASWTSPPERPIDYRFVNAEWIESSDAERISERGDSDENFRYWFNQYVSRFDFASFDADLRNLFPSLLQKKSASLVMRVFRDQKTLAPVAIEPRDFMLFN